MSVNPTDEAVAEAMQDAWNSIVTDTGFHPMDLAHERGRRLTFTASHWARITAETLRAKADPEMGVWPDFIAPAKYPNPTAGWTDPRLPDFRLIWQVARTAGYSVGLHGSMKRDCDLIAVPWVEAYATPEALIEALCTALDAREVGPREPKPNGRIAVCLQIDGYYRLIDLSIVGAQ